MRCLAALLLCLLCAPAHADMARDVTQAVRASWYDCRQPGECSKSKRTANGERFNPNGMTAAHRSLPFGTRLRVCHHGRCCVVRINDRGPWIAGRSLDLASGAARAIGMTGVASVTIQRM
jgi:rare lipoprotein A